MPKAMTINYLAIQSAPVCSGSVSLQDVYNSSHMLGPIEVTPDNQDNSIRFMIPSSRKNLNRFYNATITLVNSAGSASSNISNISECNCYIYFSCYKIFHSIQVLMMYRTSLTTFKMNQLLSLSTTLRILKHWGLY